MSSSTRRPPGRSSSSRAGRLTTTRTTATNRWSSSPSTCRSATAACHHWSPSVPCDLLIAGAEVVAESGVRRTNVAVADGIVTSIGDEAPRAARTINAEGLVLLPGGVDPHTHLNSVWPFPDERRPADDFASGSRAAAAGGITTVCDFVYHLG